MAFLKGKNRNKKKEKSSGFFVSMGRGLYRNFFYVTAWISFGLLKEYSVGLFRGIKRNFQKPKVSTNSETFEQAMFRLGVTEKEVRERYRYFKLQFSLYSILAVLITCYIIYLLISWVLLPAVVALILALACVVKAANMRFYMYQIRKRQLGCSLREWLSATQAKGDIK